MEFIHQTAQEVNSFKANSDVDIVPAANILCKVEPPMPVSSSRCSTFKLTDKDFLNIQNAFENFDV